MQTFPNGVVGVVVAGMIVMVAVSHAALGQDSVGLEQGIDDQQEAGEGAADQPANEPAIEAPSALPPIAPAETSGNIHDGGYRGDERQDSNERLPIGERYIEWRDTFAQWLMAAFGVLATGISIWAVFLLKQTLRATRDAVAEARSATTAAERSVDVAQEIGKAQTRAYLAAHKAILHDLNAGRDFAFEIIIKNFGQTPAYKVNIFSGLKVLKADLDKVPSIKMQITRTNDIYPGQEVFFTITGNPKAWPMMRGLVNSGSYDLFVVGEVTYCDAYGNEGKNGFRFWMPDQIRLGANPMSEYSGDNDAP